MKKYFNKKDVITFIVIFIIASMTLIGYFPMHYATDTYNIINIGYEEYMMNFSLKDGRPIMALIVYLAGVINIPIEIWIPTLLVISIIISCLAVMTLKNIVLSYKPAKNKWAEIIVLIISYCTIFNFTYLENLYFAEGAVMALSILAYILSAKNIIKKHYVKAVLWGILGVMLYQGTIGILAIMAVLFTFLENKDSEKFIRKVILDLIKTIVIMLFIGILNLVIIKGICSITGMTGDRTQDISGIINNIKYIFNNYIIVITNTGGMLASGSFVKLLLITSVSATILFIIYSKKPVENLIQLFLIIIVAIASGFIASAMSLTGYHSARIRFTIGAVIGIIFIHMYCKSELFENTKSLEIIFSGIVIIYTIINMYTYISITLQHRKTNEFEKYEANQIESVIENYEENNNIKVDKICIVKKAENNQIIPEAKNRCVPTFIATRCEWGVAGTLQYYEDRILTKAEADSLEYQEFLLSGKQYKCIGETLYVNVSVY